MQRVKTMHSLQAIIGLAALLIGTYLLRNTPFTYYGWAAVTYITVKLVLSWRHQNHTDPVADKTVDVVIPVYNEHQELVDQVIDSIVNQTYPIGTIWVVDDGSDIPVQINNPAPNITLIRTHNQGKRHAQTEAFKHIKSDITVTVDSDTILARDCVEELVKPFKNPDVNGATAHVKAFNHDTNWLTKMISMRYLNAFMFDRAAYSSLGSVLCACGSTSAWRTAIIRDNLDDYTNQTFLNETVAFGDDRRLTNYSLLEGEVVLQSTAVSYTAVPQNMSHLVRQQIRWNRSFVRETLWAIKNLPYNKPGKWLSLSEAILWILYSIIIVAVIAYSTKAVAIGIGVYYLLYLILFSYLRSLKWFSDQDLTLKQKLSGILLAPSYAVLHILLLIPIRVGTLLTLKTSKWGTRTKVEQLTMDTTPTENRSFLSGI